MRANRVALLLAALFVPLMVAAVRAQDETRYSIVKVPFTFTAANQEMPAGEYEISERDGGSIQISSRDNHHVAVLAAGEVELPDVPGDTKVVFNRYGDRYFLARIVRQGDRMASEVRLSADEQRLARASAAQPIEVPAKPAK